MALLAPMLAVLLTGCGDDAADVDTGRAEEPTTEAAGDGLRPAGTDLADGIAVPEGAALAGAVFANPFAPSEGGPGAQSDDGWQALLVLVDDDPFAAFDALAEQVRALGPELPGSADSCSWVLLSEEPGDLGPRVAVDGPAPPADAIAELRCEATASDGERTIDVILEWGDDHPGTLRVSGTQGGRAFAIGGRGELYDPSGGTDQEDLVPPECASTCDGEPAAPATPTTRQPPDTLPPTGPDPVSSEALDLLPARPQAERPAAGEPFGGESGCFATVRDRFVLPEGSTLAATVGGYDATSVLVVDDVDAAIEDLVAQAGAADPGGVYGGEVEDTTLGDGTTVRTAGLQGDAGGTCRFLGSADGRHLLITMGPD